ncbi:MAG: diguanylate cyclase [Sulfurimonas sp.]|nr:diguanylate cyclase [Sulfurimonas sp.]
MKINLLKKRYFIIIFIVIISIIYGVSYNYFKNLKDEYLKEKTQLIYLEYKVIYDMHKSIANLIFKTDINKAEVIELFKNRDRDKLYKTLQSDYKVLRTFGVRQLHFHLPNNDSFLRMHRPLKFGDNLSKARLTVKYVNEELKPISGFEGGKVINGFRFVYPLFDKEEHIGSVEVSFSALVFIEKIVKHYDVLSNFHIDKKVVKQKVFKDEQSNYVQSSLFQYYCQKSIVDYLNLDISDKMRSKVESESIYKQINKAKPFSQYDKKLNNIMTFIPVLNPITNDVVAVFTFRSEDNYIEINNKNLQIIFFISILVVVIVLFLIYKEFNYKYILEKNIKKKTKDIEEFNLLLNNVIKGANLGYWDWYPQTKEYFVNERWLEMLGLSKSDITNTQSDWQDRIFKEDLKYILSIVADAIEKNKPYTIEFRMRHKNGNYIWIKGSGSVVERDSLNRVIRMSGTHADITQRKEAQAILLKQKDILEYQANHDALTGLKNRLTLNADIEKTILNYNSHQAPYSILMFDIDFFKKINDNYGHDTGDLVLKELSNLLKLSVREGDKIYRAGGEEFVVLLNRISYEDTMRVAQKIRLVVQNHIFKVKDEEFSTTISAGLYHSSLVKIEDVKEVLKLADIALYKSKENGRNRVTDVGN